MIDIKKLEFINVSLYIAEFKAIVEHLYKQHKIVMSVAARNDLNRITAETVTRNFSLSELKEWQQGNKLLGIKSYLDYENILTGIAIDVNQSQQKKKLPSIQTKLSASEYNIVTRSLSHWDAFTNLFYNEIENIDTLKVILKNIEKQQAKLLGYETTLDENDLASFYNEKLEHLSRFLKQRINSLGTISPVVSEQAVQNRLKTVITVEFFQDIIHQLAEFGYIPHDFISNPQLAELWFNYALRIDGKQNRPARKCTIKWISTSISLAQFVMLMCDERAFLYKENDKSSLYKWVHRCFNYGGNKSTLETDLRRAHRETNKPFVLKRKRGNQFEFSVIQKARKPKSR
jgi:hypothetical protein